MRRVILTGGTGFVGVNLARRLLQNGHDVHLLVRPGFATWRLQDIRQDLQLHMIDLSEREGIREVVRQIGADWIFHLAVYGAYPQQSDMHEMIRTNVVGTANLVDACLQTGFEAFVNTGSSSEYGYKGWAPTEEEAPEPNSYYAVTKVSSTLFCRHSAEAAGVRIPTLRLYSVYGPYEEPTRLMPTLITDALQGGLPPLVSPDIARDFVYVDDVVDAYLQAAVCPVDEFGPVYNIGTGVQTSLADLVAVVREMFQVSVEPKWGSLGPRSWDTTVWIANVAKARQELNWNPETPLREGLHRLATHLNGGREWLAYHRQRRPA